MTTLVRFDHEGFLPVNFRIYKKFEFGKKKGQVDPDSVHSITLNRACHLSDRTYWSKDAYESVKDTIDRLKEMIHKGTYYSIVSAKEANWEREDRMKAHNLEVVPEATVPITNSTATTVTDHKVVPPKAVNDEEITTSKAKGKSAKAKKDAEPIAA